MLHNRSIFLTQSSSSFDTPLPIPIAVSEGQLSEHQMPDRTLPVQVPLSNQVLPGLPTSLVTHTTGT